MSVLKTVLDMTGALCSHIKISITQKRALSLPYPQGEQAGVEVGYLPSTPGTRVQIPGRASE